MSHKQRQTVSQSLPALLLLLLLGCSVVQASKRIVAGANAAVGAHPYAVSVQLAADGTHRCGGVIINTRYILTAAHCVCVGTGIEPYPARTYQVRAGSVQRLVGGQLLRLKRIVVHSAYDKSSNDLALLELETALTLNANTQAIELASELPPAGAQITVAGWGASYTQGPNAQRLQVGTLQALSAAECEQQLFMAHEGLLCLARAATAEAQQGLCNGDAGSPAVYAQQLVGIGGFFVTGCGSSLPDGYANIAHYLDWINANSV